MASSSKNQRPLKGKNITSGKDMISSLPDEVLVHILSFLPTKDAFRTSLLSSRWENVWTEVPILDFRPNSYDLPSLDDDKDPRYMDFVEMVFASLNSTSINKFHMHFNYHWDMVYRLSNWMSAAVECNVQDIQITHRYDIWLPLPDSFFTCKTLVTLKLAFYLHIDVPASVYFPRLKVLDISLMSPDEDLTQKLFCSCPVLEELYLDVEKDCGDSIYNISSPCLKKLVLSIKTSRRKNFDIVVNIDAPILECLDVDDAYSAHFILKNSSALVKAKVSADLQCYYDESIRKKFPVENLIMLLKTVSFVKDLSLRGRFPIAVFGSIPGIKWLLFSNVTRLELYNLDDFDSSGFSRWPVFPNLKHLQLNVDDDFASKKLSVLLELAPHLASLILDTGYSSKKREQINCSEQRVPGCFRSCLKEIEVRNLKGSESELKLIQYLLVNAQVLENLTVGVANYNIHFRKQKPGELKSIIDLMPKCSKNLKLTFI